MNFLTCSSTDFSWRINPCAHPTLCKVCQLSRIEACLIPSTSFIMSPLLMTPPVATARGPPGCVFLCVWMHVYRRAHITCRSHLAWRHTNPQHTHTHTPHMPPRHAWPSSTLSEDLMSFYDTRGVNCRPPADWCERTGSEPRQDKKANKVLKFYVKICPNIYSN